MKAIIYIGICILCILCAVEGIFLYRMHKQLNEWFIFLQSIKEAPARKNFVKGRGLLAGINYAMNDVLEENRNRLTQLTRAEEANKLLLTNLSHDVRTPLASLTGYLEALERGLVTGDAKEEYIRIACRKASDLKELVDILFDWFKINAEEQTYEIKRHDVNELTRQIIIGWLPITDQKQIRLNVNIPENELFLQIDQIAYERIVNNLIGNAIQHGNCTQLFVAVCPNEDTVTIEISNNGLTIPGADIPFLFDRLYTNTSHKEAAEPRTGSGLGLAIVKALTEAMHGSISVASSSGKTSFYLYFPSAPKK